MAAVGGGAGLGAAALGDILSGSEGPGRRHPPLAGDRATPPRRQGGGASRRLFNPLEVNGGVCVRALP